METVTLLKRNDDQQEGTVTAYVLFNCRRSPIEKDKEPLLQDMNAGSRTVWHIPYVELSRVGVGYLNALDRIVDTASGSPRYWMMEVGSEIRHKLFLNWYTVTMVMVNPPPTEAD